MKNDNNVDTGILLLLYSIGNNLGNNNVKKKITLEDKLDMLDDEMAAQTANVNSVIAQIEDREYDLECMLDDLEDYLEDREYGLSRSTFSRSKRKEIEQMSDEEILEEIEKINEELLQCNKEKDEILTGGGIWERIPLIKSMFFSLLLIIKSLITLVVLIIGLIILFKFIISLFL